MVKHSGEIHVFGGLGMIPTGCQSIDNLLQGGVKEGEISLFYGAMAAGKTSLALQCAIGCALRGFKAIYAHTHEPFAIERFIQIAGSRWRELGRYIPIFRLQSFEEQEAFIESLEKYVVKDVKLIAFDTISDLYRSSLVDELKENIILNKMLNRQMAILLNLAKKHDLAVLATSQMRISIDKDGEAVEEPIAASILDHWASVIVKLKQTRSVGVRRAEILKHPTIAKGRSIEYIITCSGLKPLEDTAL